jgi:hypothetical protein
MNPSSAPVLIIPIPESPGKGAKFTLNRAAKQKSVLGVHNGKPLISMETIGNA